MRSSAVIALAILSASAPAFSAPLVARDTTTDESGALNTGLIKDVVSIGNDVVSGIQGIKSLFDREDLELLARAVPTTAAPASSLPTDESGAFNIGHILSTVAGIASNFLKREDFELFSREDLELLARADPSTLPTDESGALNIGHIFSTIAGIASNFLKREDLELLARAAPATTAASLPTDESGALDIGKIFSTIAGIASNFLKREELEILARDVPTDESGALNTGLIKDVVEIGNGIVNGVQGIKSLFDREELELLARAVPASAPSTTSLPTDESGALDIGKILSTIAGLVSNFLKREELEMIARDTAAVPIDESGALNTGLIKDFVEIGNGIVNGVQGIKSLFNREDLELLSRAAPSAAAIPTDESGALNIGHILSTIAGIASNFLKREDLELLARDATILPTDQSGALNIGHILSTIAGIASNFLKRDDLHMFAREDVLQLRELHDVIARDAATVAASPDQSGALDIGKIVSTIAGFFLKREEMLQARDSTLRSSFRIPVRRPRSLNDLD